MLLTHQFSLSLLSITIRSSEVIMALVVGFMSTKIWKSVVYLGFIREQAIYYIGVYAQDAAQAYYDSMDSYLYKICVITGEIAVDEDDDEYIELSYDEATQICKSLNEEAEEELFVIKRM